MTGTAADALREALAFGAFIIGFPLALAALCGGLCWVAKKLRPTKE
ncbi:hypothetical protein J6U76_08700 [bacterium]|nr:hypothetical protein [bacterium]